VPKQFALWRGKPVVRHAAEALVAAGAGPLVVAIPDGAETIAVEACGPAGVRWSTGGATRQASVRAALEALGRRARLVLIHDAARPACPADVVDACSARSTSPGAIPVCRRRQPRAGRRA
jgi:2-C-methyl-D-erythritol 4-phosphate cytidylyltransferase/2-C-methyl-D-erythritol 2,4-cyclodiphosphate synthase